MYAKLTDKKKRVRNSRGEIVTVYQVIAAKDFDITTFDGRNYKIKRIKQGQRGGYVENSSSLGNRAWIHKDTTITGHSRFFGVTCGYAQIEDSIVHQGAIISGRGAVIRNSSIGHDVTIYGTTRICHSMIKENAFIVGTAIYDSTVGKSAAIKCAKAIKNQEVEDYSQLSYSDN